MSTVDNYLALVASSWSWFRYGAVSVTPVGQPAIVTYSFETSPSADVRLVGSQAFLDSFQPLTDAQKALAKAALDAWSAASGLIFIEAKPGLGDIRIGVYDFDKGGPFPATEATGYAYAPGNGLGGDVFISKTSALKAQLFLHEIGHALGMKHPFDGDPRLAADLDNYSHTVMSYTSGGAPGDVLGDLDRAAAAYLYGAPGAPMPGPWSWDAASQVLTQTNKTAGAVIHGVSSGNAITAGDRATIVAGVLGNAITAGDKASVYWLGGASAPSSGAFASVLTLGADAMVFAPGYHGGLDISAGDRADITLPGSFGANASTVSARIRMGAGGKIAGNGFNGRIEITAGDSATINLPYLSATTPNPALNSLVVAGESAKIDAAGYMHGLTIKTGAKASVQVGLGLVDVVVGDGSIVYLYNDTPLTPKSDQISHFTFGANGFFSAKAAVATNLVRVTSGANILGGKGSDIVFVAGKNTYVDGGDGTDLVVLDGAAPASFPATTSSTGGRVSWINNGDVMVTNVEYAQFSNALYSFTQQKYLTDFPALKTAYGALLRTTGLETSYLAIADLADRVGAAKLTSAGAMAEIVKAAGATTSVATLAYEFFTGKIPGQAGVDYLVSPTGPNGNNLNSAYYQSFNLENRYINFAVNLGKLGEGKDAFAAKYGAISLFDATREAYKTIFGAAPTDAKIHALIDTRTDYFAAYGGDGASGIGTKAAMVGWLLAEAVKADIGVMAKSNDAWLLDLSDGSAPFAINLLDPTQGYFKSDFIFGGT